MKILITTDVYFKVDGVSTSVKNLYSSLVDMGHEVRVLTLSNEYKNYKSDDVYLVKSLPLDVVYKGIRMAFTLNGYFVDEISKWKPDVIHSQCEFFTYKYALKIAKITGAPIIHTYHTMYEDYVSYVTIFKKFGLVALRKFINKRLKDVDTIITPTKKVEKALLSYGINKPLAVIPSGINICQHQQKMLDSERKKLRNDFGVKDNEILLLSLGRVAYEKNLQEIVDNFKKTVKTHPYLKLMIVGDGPYRKTLEKLTLELGVMDKVVFVGMVNPSKVHLYYQIGDIFVNASTSETQGLTYVEALANGLPLLCKKDDCLDGVLIEDKTGYFYNNDVEYINALEKLLSADKRKEISKNSLLHSALFDKKNFAKAVTEVYDKVLNKKSG